MDFDELFTYPTAVVLMSNPTKLNELFKLELQEAWDPSKSFGTKKRDYP